MNIRPAVLMALFMACCTASSTQEIFPSIAIGKHVLKLGMDESTVLEQLGLDLHLESVSDPNPQVSDWMVMKKVDGLYQLAGEVSFSSHKLSSATRSWEVEESSSKSLFYALQDAVRSLETDGLRNCKVSTTSTTEMMDSPSGSGSGSVTTQAITMNCGVKRILITLQLSDLPDVDATSIHVMETLRDE